jgi:hypothetical protein
MKGLKLILILLPLALIVFFLVRLIDFSGFFAPTGEPFVEINNRTYTDGDYTAMYMVHSSYPIQREDLLYPGNRSETTALVDAVLLYDEASPYKKELKKDATWDMLHTFWKGRYYFLEFLVKNYGFTEEEIREYYLTEMVSLIPNSDEDDDVVIETYRNEILDSLFLDTHEPPQDFLDQAGNRSESDIRSLWLKSFKASRHKFFLEKFYRDKHGSGLPSDWESFTDTSDMVSEEELDIVTQWLPQSHYRAENRYSYAQYILAWKLFGENADETGFTRSDTYQKSVDWFDRYAVVHHYLNTVLGNKIDPLIEERPQHFTYKYQDETGKPRSLPHTSSYQERYDQYTRKLTKMALNSYISNKRRDAAVVFDSPDDEDIKHSSPEELFARADSLLDADNSQRARVFFRDLKNHFLYSPFGQKALIKLAEIYEHNNSYMKAINCYRDFILFSREEPEYCKWYFLIGNLYDERLNDYERAAANYAWVIRNSDKCQIAQDAEFMYLNIGEPIPEIDELRARAERQGITESDE